MSDEENCLQKYVDLYMSGKWREAVDLIDEDIKRQKQKITFGKMREAITIERVGEVFGESVKKTLLDEKITFGKVIPRDYITHTLNKDYVKAHISSKRFYKFDNM